MTKILFNVPNQTLTFKSKKIVKLNTFSGNGYWTKKVQNKLEKKFSFKKVLLTDSCTSALEIAALSLKLNKKNDEIIIPSYSYPTTASSFLRCGYKIKFVDCEKNEPRINKKHLMKLINKNTKALVVVHHAGQPDDIEFFLKLRKKYNFMLIEDAAQCIDLKIGKKYLGSYGDFGCISFHESKNIHCGLGGALIINNQSYSDLSHYIWERGTNRKDFDNKKISKYTWIEVGSNFYPSEFQSVYLYDQINTLHFIKKKRKFFYNLYEVYLKKLIQKKIIIGMNLKLKSNFHMKYILLKNKNERNMLKEFLYQKGIHTVSHYEPLHLSKVGKKLNSSKLVYSKSFSERILRLPMHTYLTKDNIKFICQTIEVFFKS